MRPYRIINLNKYTVTGKITNDGTLNIYSKVGLVTLIGLITKHGILIVDFANKIREQGVNVVRAVRQAAYMRLRPILMTTFAMVIGTIPLALAKGAGAASRQQIGWSIVGGMSFGTLFTLFIVPVMYIIFSKTQVPSIILRLVPLFVHILIIIYHTFNSKKEGFPKKVELFLVSLSYSLQYNIPMPLLKKIYGEKNAVNDQKSLRRCRFIFSYGDVNTLDGKELSHICQKSFFSRLLC